MSSHEAKRNSEEKPNDAFRVYLKAIISEKSTLQVSDIHSIRR